MKTSTIFLVVSLIAGLGGWMVTLDTWSLALTTTNLGGLLMVEAGVVIAWLNKSPMSFNGKPVLTTKDEPK